MKLVIDLRMVNSSGIGTYLKNIIPNVVKSHKELIFLGNKEELSKFEWTKNIEIIEFNAPIYSIKEQFLYYKTIPKCDVFWCPHFNVPLFYTKAKKIICTIYDVNHLSPISTIKGLKKKYAYILYKNASLISEIIFTISEFSKQEIIKYTNIKEDKIKLVYAGIDTSFFSKTNQSSNFKFPENYFLFVGNVKPHKNLIVLLKSFLLLSNEIKAKYKIVILGKKEGFITSNNFIFDFIERNKMEANILFTGYLSDNEVPLAYKKASLFIFPSLYEGFGLPILEAMSCNIPIISSNAASLPEVGGDAVIYFDPKNHKELAHKVSDLILDETLKTNLKKKYKNQLDKYNWGDSAKLHLREIEKIITDK